MIIDDSFTYGEQLGIFFSTGFPWIVLAVSFVVTPIVHVFKGEFELVGNLVAGFVQAAIYSALVILPAPLFLGGLFMVTGVAGQLNEGYGLDEKSGWVTVGDVRELYAKPGEVVNLSLVDAEDGNGVSSGGDVLFGVFDEGKKRVTLFTGEPGVGSVDVDDLVELTLVK